MLSLLKNISNDWRYVGDLSMMIHGRNPDFWDGKTSLIEFFGEPWHPKTDEEQGVTHYGKHGYSFLVVWWEELYKNKNTHGLENRIREWYEMTSQKRVSYFV